MKSFTAITSVVALLLASTAIASPVPALGEESVAERGIACTGKQVTLAFSNDMTGAWITRDFCIDNAAINLDTLLQGSSLHRDGKILATSVVVTQGLANSPYCSIQDVNGDLWGPLSAQKTYLKLGSDPNHVSFLDLTTKRVQCVVEGNFKCTGIFGEPYTTCIKTGVRPN